MLYLAALLLRVCLVHEMKTHVYDKNQKYSRYIRVNTVPTVNSDVSLYESISSEVSADCGPEFNKAPQPDLLVNQAKMGHHCQRLLLSGNTIKNDLQWLRGNVVMLQMRKNSSTGSETHELKIASRRDIFTAQWDHDLFPPNQRCFYELFPLLSKPQGHMVSIV